MEHKVTTMPTMTDHDERELLRAFEQGELKSVATKSELEKFKSSDMQQRDRTTTEKLDRQFHRLLISKKDMEKAIAYLSAAAKANTAGESDATAGLIAAAIVAYARPFSGNKNHPRVTPNPPQPDRWLTREEKDLHKRIVELRNEVIAHSDADRNPTKVSEYRATGFRVSSRVYDPIFEVEDIPRFLALSTRVLRWFDDKMFSISKQVSQSA
jgi:hypothetical protein